MVYILKPVNLLISLGWTVFLSENSALWLFVHCSFIEYEQGYSFCFYSFWVENQSVFQLHQEKLRISMRTRLHHLLSLVCMSGFDSVFQIFAKKLDVSVRIRLFSSVCCSKFLIWIETMRCTVTSSHLGSRTRLSPFPFLSAFLTLNASLGSTDIR